MSNKEAEICFNTHKKGRKLGEFNTYKDIKDKKSRGKQWEELFDWFQQRDGRTSATKTKRNRKGASTI